MPAPRIAAIILQYGHWQKTLLCVQSLLASTLAPAWIVVIDNASPDDSPTALANALEHACGGMAICAPDGLPPPQARLILVRLPSNRGYAAGNNAGIRLGLELGAEAFLIINNDAYVQPDALRAMWDKLRSLERPGLCGPLLAYKRPGAPVQCCAGGRTNYVTGLSAFSGCDLNVEQAMAQDEAGVEAGLNFICGACQLASREFIEQVGLLDEGYFLYCEEQDWALRACGRFDFGYAASALVYHEEGASTGWNRFSFHWRSSLSMFRSRLRLAWIHHPWLLPTVACGCAYAAMRLGARKMAALLKNKG